jgi:hypothetical protein
MRRICTYRSTTKEYEKPNSHMLALGLFSPGQMTLLYANQAAARTGATTSAPTFQTRPRSPAE